MAILSRIAFVDASRIARSSALTSSAPDVQLTAAVITMQPGGWAGSVYASAIAYSSRSTATRASGSSASTCPLTAPKVTPYRWIASLNSARLSPKAAYRLGGLIPIAAVSPATEVASYPCSQNSVTARSSAASRSNPRGRPAVLGMRTIV